MEAAICLFVCNLQAEKKARIRQDKLEKGSAKAAEGLEKCKFCFIFLFVSRISLLVQH
jgi:hypothetical protein